MIRFPFAIEGSPNVNDLKILLPLVLVALLNVELTFAKGGKLTSGEYFVTQSWSQEQDFKRPYYVQVPEGVEGKLPVFVFLHGNGGNGKGEFFRDRQMLDIEAPAICGLLAYDHLDG